MAPRSSRGAETVTVLPYGLVRGGRAQRRFAVRPLGGHDELALAEAVLDGMTPLAAATLLLGRVALADGRPIGAAAGDLVLGDREVLLRALYAATVAPAVEAAVPCAQGCGALTEFTLDLESLARPVPEPGPSHVRRVGGREVALRLLTGRDLDEAATAGDPDRLVAAATGGEPADRAGVAAALAELDPNAECAVTVACAGCGAPATYYVDGMALIRSALDAQGGVLRQIDRLARAYGWSEDAILSLPRARRLRYCAIIAEEAA